jgi:predicted acylesterase/phospholipase RssA
MSSHLRSLHNLFRKRDKASGHEDIRAYLLIMGGGMRAFYSAGSLLEFHEHGLTADIFDGIVGISVGALGGAYFCGGQEQTQQAVELCLETVNEEGFIDLRRLRSGIVDVPRIIERMRKGPRALNVEILRQSKTDFYVGLTAQSGEHVFFDAKEARPDVFAAIQAAMAFPGLSPWKVSVNGAYYMDRVFDLDIVRDVIRAFKPTDLLILPNLTYRQASRLQCNRTSIMLSAAFLLNARHFPAWPTTSKQRFTSLLKHAEHPDVNVSILWPPELNLNQLSRKVIPLQHAMTEARENVRIQFASLKA